MSQFFFIHTHTQFELKSHYYVHFRTNTLGKGMNSFITPGAHGVMVKVVGNGHGDTSSNPGRDLLHFTLH